MLEEQREHLLANGRITKLTPARYKNRLPYLREVDSLALANEQLNLESAFRNYFKNKHNGFPKFKSKKTDRNSYTTNLVNDNIVIGNNVIKLPKVGEIKTRMHRKIEDGLKLKSVCISKEKDETYYASILYEYEDDEIEKRDGISHIGLDYKQDGLYVDSNGNCADMPHFYKKSLRKYKRYQKRLSKKDKESNNYQKQKVRLAKQARHITNQRKDYLHKLSNEITNHYELVSVEKLDLKKMSKKEKKMGKSIYDNGYGMFQRMIEYKQIRKRHHFIKVDEKYPSSQLCSKCGYKNPITKDLKVRKITCPECGDEYDRDINAAINIDREGYRNYLSQI